MDIILAIINHPNVPWMVAAGIIAFALLVWLIFSLKINMVARHLSQVEKQLAYATTAGFAKHLQGLNKDFKNNPVFFPQWHNFQQTLIAPKLHQGKQVMIYTTRLSHYFNFQTLVSSQFNMRLYQAMPNILVGIGIWFTFVGLVAALWFASKGVAAADINEAQLALQELLHAATFKFVTSIAGLFASIVFSWREKKRLYSLQQQINAICHKLEECLHFSTLEKILLQQQNQPQKEDDIKQLIQSLPAVLTQALQPLNKNFANLTENIGANNQEALQLLLSDFSQRLQGQTSETFAQLHQSLQTMNGSIQQVQQQFDHSGQQFHQHLSQAGSDLQQGLSAVSEQLLQQLNQAAQQIYTSSQHLQAASQPLSKTAESLHQTTEKIEQLLVQNQKSNQALQQSSEQVTSVWKHYEQHFSGIDTEMGQVFKSLTQGLEQYRHQVTEFTESLDNSLNHAVTALNGMVLELAEVLEDLRSEK